MKTVTLRKESWLNGLPKNKRAQLVREMFSLAKEYDWTIRMEGQHYAD